MKKHLEYLDDEGFCALHYACKHLNLEMVQYLLRKGCDPNIRTAEGESPLDLLEKSKLKIEIKVGRKKQLHQIAQSLESLLRDSVGDSSERKMAE